MRGQREVYSNPSPYVFCSLSLFPSFFLFVLDKLDEILAAAQHTITSDNQGQKGHVGKRDRSKSIVPNVSNEVRWELEGKDFSSGQLQASWPLVSIMLANSHGPFCQSFLLLLDISHVHLWK